MADFLYSCAAGCSRGWSDEEEWVTLWISLAEQDRTRLVGFVARFAPTMFARFCRAVGFHAELDVVRGTREFSSERLAWLVRTRTPVFVITERAKSAVAAALRNCETHYIRATVMEHVFNAETLRREESKRHISVAIPARIIAMLRELSKWMDDNAGEVVEDWTQAVGPIEAAIEQFLRKLTAQRNDPKISGNREMVSGGEFKSWLLASINAAVQVDPSTLMQLEEARAAWRYEPQECPAFFV